MNARKQYEQQLRAMTIDALQTERRRTSSQYHAAREQGHIALYAVLWFDLAQVCDEIDRRKQ